MIVFEASDVTIPAGECGMHSFMYRGEACRRFEAVLHRENVAGKIHHMPLRPGESLDDYLWGQHYLPAGERSLLCEAVAIQNIYAALGLAPRVYAIALWRDQYGQERPVQLVEDMGRCDWDQPREDVYALHDQIKAIGEMTGIMVPGRDEGVQNAIEGRWVDFGGFQYGPGFHPDLLARYYKGVQWGDRPYQQVLSGNNGVDTCRNVDIRIADLGLDRLDFTPTHVLDIGCSGGQFLNYLTQRYNARGTGYDTPNAIRAAAEYSAVIGAWNIDYHEADLRKPDAMAGQYDLVLFLSMSRHVGLPDYVKQVSAKRLIMEVHSEHEAEVRDWLGEDFTIRREQTSADYGRLVIHAERQIEQVRSG